MHDFPSPHGHGDAGLYEKTDSEIVNVTPLFFAHARATAGESVASSGLLSRQDHARLRATFETSYDLVYRFLRRLGLDASMADDGAQQAFVVLMQRIADVEEGKERAFLCSSSILIARRLRLRGSREMLDDGHVSEPKDERPQPDEVVEADQRRALLDDILSQMPEDLRSVLVLAEIEGHGKRELSQVLGIPEGTVASRLRRAREDFHARLHRSNKLAEFGSRSRIALTG